MNERSTNQEREALIAGDRVLTPEESEELSMFADLLADPATWSEPRSGLEQEVVEAVEDAPAVRARHTGRRLALTVVAAAALIAAVLFVSVGVLANHSSADYRADLTGTALARNAHASVVVRETSSGFHISLNAHGLPALPAGEYYQAWLKNEKNVLVPIGTFSSSDSHVTLWSGVSPKDYPTLTVTIEKADNNQDSSGQRVLTGTAHAS
jgi:hypothetical protein